MIEDIDFLKYPVGKFSPPDIISHTQINEWISELESFPHDVRIVSTNLADYQLDTAYRPGGWTLRQVLHHLADSHLNAYIRFKLAVTEDKPVIRPYDQDGWAECGEARLAPVTLSISLLESLHFRWVSFLKTLTEQQFNRIYIHPEHHKEFVLKEVLGMYVWHGKHHLAHIMDTIKRNNWTGASQK